MRPTPTQWSTLLTAKGERRGRWRRDNEIELTRLVGSKEGLDPMRRCNCGYCRVCTEYQDSPNTKQPTAIPNGHPAIWDLVRSDMDERDLFGAKKHGTRLQPHNGRDVLKDAYQEALDLVAYLRQAIFERDGI